LMRSTRRRALPCLPHATWFGLRSRVHKGRDKIKLSCSQVFMLHAGCADRARLWTPCNARGEGRAQRTKDKGDCPANIAGPHSVDVEAVLALTDPRDALIGDRLGGDALVDALRVRLDARRQALLELGRREVAAEARRLALARAGHPLRLRSGSGSGLLCRCVESGGMQAPSSTLTAPISSTSGPISSTRTVDRCILPAQQINPCFLIPDSLLLREARGVWCSQRIWWSSLVCIDSRQHGRTAGAKPHLELAPQQRVL
jgi:hypothetical protein